MPRNNTGSSEKFRESVEALIDKFGGPRGFAEMLYTNMTQATSEAMKEKWVGMAVRMMRQAEDMRGGAQDMSPEELQSELGKMLIRYLTYMPNDEFDLVISKTKELRARGSVTIATTIAGG